MTSWVMPLARHSKTSATEILAPGTQDLPLRTLGIQIISGEDEDGMERGLRLKCYESGGWHRLIPLHQETKSARSDPSTRGANRGP
jgi:hypothetical protein